jgi:hypothetical protein
MEEPLKYLTLFVYMYRLNFRIVEKENNVLKGKILKKQISVVVEILYLSLFLVFFKHFKFCLVVFFFICRSLRFYQGRDFIFVQVQVSLY